MDLLLLKDNPNEQKIAQAYILQGQASIQNSRKENHFVWQIPHSRTEKTLMDDPTTKNRGTKQNNQK